MKRSGDITASAIVLFCGSGLLVLFMLLGILGAALTQLPQAARFGQLMGLAFYAIFAGWGIVTAVGILGLRPWARISIFVMSATAIFFCVCGAVGLMVVPVILRQTPNAPPGFATIFVVVGIFMLLIPLGIAIWWLVLFTRKRVIVEFASDGVAGLAVQSEAFDASSLSPQFAPASMTPQIPLSIRIITALYLVFSAFAVLTVPYSIRLKIPTLVMGKIVDGWPAWTFLTLLVVVQIVLCVAVLKKRTWALDGLIAVLIFGAVNSAFFAIAPSRTALWNRVLQAESLPPNVGAVSMESFMNTIMPISISVGIVFALVCLYFLLTRRRAFRTVCSGGQATPPAEAGIAS